MLLSTRYANLLGLSKQMHLMKKVCLVDTKNVRRQNEFNGLVTKAVNSCSVPE